MICTHQIQTWELFRIARLHTNTDQMQWNTDTDTPNKQYTLVGDSSIRPTEKCHKVLLAGSTLIYVLLCPWYAYRRAI